MLIPIGFFGGEVPVGPPAYEQISTVIGNASFGTFTFSSIPQTYKHLEIRASSRHATTVGTYGFLLQFNGLTTPNNYHIHTLFNSSASASNNSPSMQMLNASTNPNIPANHFSNAVVTIPDYSLTTKRKTGFYLGGFAGNGDTRVVAESFLANFNNDAITSIRVFTSAGDAFVSGARFTLYGIKG